MIGSEKGKGRVIESLIIPQVINNRKISTRYLMKVSSGERALMKDKRVYAQRRAILSVASSRTWQTSEVEK